MPIYEYACRPCGHRFEALVRGSETPACPSCQSQDLERILSLFAVNSEDRSKAALRGARKRLAQSKNRRDQLQHEREEIQEHMRDDYGVEIAKSEGKPPAG